MGNLEFKPFTGGELDFRPTVGIIIPPPDPVEYIVAGFPVVLNGRTFSNTTLGGRNYVVDYPDLLQEVVNHSNHTNYYSDSISVGDFYPEIGELNLTLSPRKKFYQGMALTLTDNYTNGKAFAYIISYNKLTGETLVRLEGYTVNRLFGPIINVTASINTPAGNSSANYYTYATGGTDSKSVQEALAKFGAPNTETKVSRIFDDFGLHFSLSFPHPYKIESVAGGGTAFNYPREGVDTAPAIYPRAGILALAVTADNDNITLSRGVAGRPLYIGAGGANTEILEIAFKIPTLGTAGVQDFILQLGYTCSGASLTNIRNFGGIVFSYSASENSGKFLTTYASNGSTTTVDSTVTAVANTWYVLRMTLSGTNIVVSLDGITRATVPSASVRSTGLADFCYPAMQLQKIDGTGERLVLLDYLSLDRSIDR